MGFVGRGCCKVGEVYRWGVVGAGAAPIECMRVRIEFIMRVKIKCMRVNNRMFESKNKMHESKNLMYESKE